MRKTLTTIALALIALTAMAQGYVPTQENLAEREDFRNAKLGIFLHWGIYSMFAQGEWYMHNANIDWREYEKAASAFYPARFDAEAWVKAFKDAGARYITFTTRHHDGFSMFHTEESDFNIVDATPYGRDVLKMLAEECHKQDIMLNLYYSHLDWRREDYPMGRTGRGTHRDASKANWTTYYRFMNNQLTELLTRYGKIGAIWFDGFWDHDSDSIPFDWQLRPQYDMIHRLQPACLIGNNHHEAIKDGEDIQIFERDLPGENSAGLSGQSISQLPLETCETMNGMWGYKITDQNYKSTHTLIQYLVKAAGKNANLLMNIGPQPDGCLPAVAVERLKEMGDWMKVYGETIYGTRGGFVAPHDWGVTTQKDNRLFVHILNLQDKVLYLPTGNKQMKKAVDFVSRKAVKMQKCQGGMLITLDSVPTDVDKVVEQLEEFADESYKAYCIAFNSDDRAEYDAYTNAIGIVKGGGI